MLHQEAIAASFDEARTDTCTESDQSELVEMCHSLADWQQPVDVLMIGSKVLSAVYTIPRDGSTGNSLPIFNFIIL